MDAGLLSGLAEGIKSGTQSYLDARKNKQDEKRDALKLAIEARSKGLTEVKDDQGNIIGYERDPNWTDPSLEFKKAELGLLAQRAAGEPQKQLQEQQERALKNEKLRAEVELAKEGKTPSKEQFDAALYAKRAEQAEDVFSNLKKQGFDRASASEGLISSLPIDALKGGKNLEQEQAERNFVNAVLRRESGAAISPSEFASAEKQYFPRVGDTPEVLAQKEANRKQAAAAFRASAGRAYEKVPTIGIQKPESNTARVKYKGKIMEIPKSDLKDALKDGAEEI